MFANYFQPVIGRHKNSQPAQSKGAFKASDAPDSRHLRPDTTNQAVL